MLAFNLLPRAVQAAGPRRPVSPVRVNLLRGAVSRIGRHGPQPWVEGAQARRLVPVAAGIDTLHLFTRWALAPAWRARLEAAKREAVEEKKTGRPVVLTVGPLELTAAPYGTAAGAYLLTSDLYAVKVSPDPMGTASPTVSIEVRALALWSRGWRDAAELAIDTMSELCGGASREALAPQVTRLDVCLDFQGWEPRPEDLDRFTCRVRRAGRGAHYGLKWLEEERSIKAERARALALLARLQKATAPAEAAEVLRELHREDTDASASTWGDDRAFSGFSFGRGIIAGRLYDKTRELSVSRKGWFREVWRRFAGERFDEAAAVWRLEFQLRREALVDFHEVTGAGATAGWHLGDWYEVAERLPALWRYLSRDWLRHGSRSSEDRKFASAPWRRVQKFDAPAGPMPELARVNLREATQTAIPQLAGYLCSAAAQLVELDPLGHRVTNAAVPFSALVVQTMAAAHAYAEAKGRPLVARFEERRRLAAGKRRTLTGPRKALAARLVARDMDAGRHQGELLTDPLLRDFGRAMGYGPRVEPTPAQRYAERCGVLVRVDEADDAADATRNRRLGELGNELAALHKALADAVELDRVELAEELRALVVERERVVESLRAA